MTYATQEITEESGEPIELYEFVIGPMSYYFTSAESDVSIGSDVYESAQIDRNEIENSPEKIKNNLSLVVARNFAIADYFRVSPPTEVILLTVKRVHRDDTDTVVVWSGRVLNCSFQGAAASLTCEPVSSSASRNGLSRKYQRNCPHTLYGPACKVNIASFTFARTVSAVSGFSLTISSAPPQSLRGGFVDWVDDDGITQRRFISAQSSTVLTLNIPFNGIAISDSINVYPGCDRTMATCDTTFSNLGNNGSFPYIPTKNPFDGTPVY